MSVWEITDVKPKSYSSAYISASNYEQDRGELIAAGVHVYPSLYRNYDLRFFTYWTTDDGVSTGCYNYYCPGFVIANNSNLHPGQALAKPLSSYDNDTRYITIRIKKDEQTGDWSLYREDQGGPIGGTTLLGWWPKTLFKGLADYATKIEWAGEVDYLSDELGPSMGSGHFSGEDEGKAAYFDDIVGFDSIGLRFTPLVKDVSSETDKEECYDVSDWRVRSFFHGGSYFYYGGPGGCT
ncbi:hypothetical protein LUZ60_004355 [Juncus effusus]|nr:hypothetical protein LUZ60_004355 [Juncus effusus]